MLCVVAIVDSAPGGYWRVRARRMRVVFSQRSGRGVSLSLHAAVVGVPARMGPVWQSLPRARTAASTSSSNHQQAADFIEVRSIGVCVWLSQRGVWLCTVMLAGMGWKHQDACSKSGGADVTALE